ncbi:adenylate/guanylate cyclase domain-containing protein [uncultured Psychrobacter sp.]|uniref:adenylate/guanylate cyclase domain-containing protein n=1 Tax=uncultured Psychrobacter sp. TaxID=259303 RepID=UPI003459B9C6
MSALNKLRTISLFKDNKDYHFDYPEVFVLLLTTLLIALHFEFNPTSITLLVIICLPSLMILIYNYSRPASFWSSNIVVILLSTVIGSMQLCPVLSLSLSLFIGYRIIVSAPENRLKLIIVSIVNIGMFYYVSTILNGTELNCNEGFLPIAVLLVSIVTMLWQFANIYYKYSSHDQTIKQSKQRLSTMVTVINKLTRFLPPQVWQPIVKLNNSVEVTNKRAKLTIMFSDIAGFTELSDHLSSDNLADILNTYMQCMTMIANKHGGVLDKFIGDGMVCFFGEPYSRGARQDALDCVAMAIDMRREMRNLRQKWRLMGFEGLYVRVGITTGYCHVGNFGSNNRLSYTIIGKEANLAARLEGIAGKGEILISQKTYDYICHDYECKYVGTYQLKGFDNTIKVWQVLDPDVDKGHSSKWVDHTLPGFNLHLNFKDIQNYDYQEIKNKLNFALEHIEKEEKKSLPDKKTKDG